LCKENGDGVGLSRAKVKPLERQKTQVWRQVWYLARAMGKRNQGYGEWLIGKASKMFDAEVPQSRLEQW